MIDSSFIHLNCPACGQLVMFVIRSVNWSQSSTLDSSVLLDLVGPHCCEKIIVSESEFGVRTI